MEFEHLVQVNDLTDASVYKMSRAQLWQGLLGRAREPDIFIEGLESFTLVEDTDDYIKRQLNFPNVVIEDQVWLTLEQQIRIEIIPSEQVAGGSLSITIEEPEPESLFVRFSYTSPSINDSSSAADYDDYVKQAYVAMDLDTIRMVREAYAAQGRLH